MLSCDHDLCLDCAANLYNFYSIPNVIFLIIDNNKNIFIFKTDFKM